MSVIIARVCDADLRTTDDRARRNAANVTLGTATILQDHDDPPCQPCGRHHQPRHRAVPCVACASPTISHHGLCARCAPEGVL